MKYCPGDILMLELLPSSLRENTITSGKKRRLWIVDRGSAMLVDYSAGKLAAKAPLILSRSKGKRPSWHLHNKGKNVKSLRGNLD